MAKSLKELLGEISDLFNLDKKGDTFAFSLNCFTDGYWKLEVSDDWHNWNDAGIRISSYKYSTPEKACEEFLKFVKKNKINIKKLQEND